MNTNVMTNEEMSKVERFILSNTEVVVKSTGHLWKFNSRWNRWENWK